MGNSSITPYLFSANLYYWRCQYWIFVSLHSLSITVLFWGSGCPFVLSVCPDISFHSASTLLVLVWRSSKGFHSCEEGRIVFLQYSHSLSQFVFLYEVKRFANITIFISLLSIHICPHFCLFSYTSNKIISNIHIVGIQLSISSTYRTVCGIRHNLQIRLILYFLSILHIYSSSSTN